MKNLVYLLQAIGLVLILAVAYAAFWVLVLFLVVFIIFQIFKVLAEEPPQDSS